MLLSERIATGRSALRPRSRSAWPMRRAAPYASRYEILRHASPLRSARKSRSGALSDHRESHSVTQRE